MQILTSGGIDSTALIKYYIDLNYNVSGLFVDYGQRSRKQEYLAVSKISKYYGIPFKKLKIEFKKDFGQGEIIGRNLFLLSIGLTEFNYQSGTIAIGIHNGTNYPDCTDQFISSTQTCFDFYKDGQIKIEAPFKNLEKPEIWRFCKENKIPIELTYSCENGVDKGCGHCLSCIDKKILYEFT